MNSITATAMYNYLKSQGFTAITLDNENTDVDQEVILANSGSYDIVISVHYNAGGGDGFECYYHSSNSKAKSSDVAKKVSEELNSINKNPYDKSKEAYTFEMNCYCSGSYDD